MHSLLLRKCDSYTYMHMYIVIMFTAVCLWFLSYYFVIIWLIVQNLKLLYLRIYMVSLYVTHKYIQLNFFLLFQVDNHNHTHPQHSYISFHLDMNIVLVSSIHWYLWLINSKNCNHMIQQHNSKYCTCIVTDYKKCHCCQINFMTSWVGISW